MSKNRSTWSALLAVVLAMAVMAGMAVTAFAETDGANVGNEHPDATIQQLAAALESGVLESGINYDVDRNGIVENDDLKFLNGELVDAGDLLDQLTEESKAGLQSLIVKGDSTRALAMTGTQSVTLDFAAPVDLGGAEKLLIDTFWTSGNGSSFQVVFLSGDKETAPVTVTAGQAGWSVVEVPFDDPTGVIIGNVTGIRIILDEGDTTYFDNFRMEGASGRVKVTADGQVYRPAAGTTYGELPTPVKTFYTFGGWMLEGNLVEASAQIENNAVLEAKWTLVASDDSTVTVADRGNNAFGLTMDGAYRQIRFDFMLKSGDFYMSYADGDDIGYNNPVITIVDVNGNAVSQTKVQPGQWYTAFIYGGSVKAVNGTITEIHDGARMATSGTLTIAEGVQMQVRNLETLTGQFGIRVTGETPTLWQMTDSDIIVDGKPVNGYNYHKQQAAQYGSHWTFSIEANRYTKMTFELYIYELNDDSAKGRTTDLTLQTLKSNGVSMKKQPVVYDMDGNPVTTADVQTGTWYKVEVDMTGASGTHYLYSTVSKGDEAKAGTYKAYIANVNFVGDGTMIDNLSPATSVTVDKAGTDGTFVTTPVTRDTDRGTYRVAGTSAKWADRVIRVSRNDDTKELIQLDFRFVADGKDVAPTLVASTGVSGTLTQAQYIILDENDAPVTTLQTGKWYRMFINANGGNVFGLVPAVSGEVELQVEGLDTFNTDELPAAMVSAGGNMSAVLTRFGKLQYIYAGNGANTVTITLNSDLYKQIRFAAKIDSAISLTGATMNTTGSGEWKNVVISNGGSNLPTTLTLNVGEGSLIIKDLVAYTSAEAPEEKTQSDIFRGLYDDEMMISGFLGPREEEHFYIARSDQKSNAYASLARDDIFKLIADVGINYISDNQVDYNGSYKENAAHILRLAAKYGINYFASATDVVEIGVKTGKKSVDYPSFLNPHDQVIYKSNIASADAIKAKLQKLYQYESFGGLYLKDEPTSDLFDEIQDAVTKINQAKQEMGNVTLNQYVNLLTWYNTTGALTNFQDYTSPAGGTAGISNKAITWEEYLKASVLDTGMNYFAFDIYPFNTDGLNSSFLNYLGMANYVAMNQTGTPWMGYAQVGGGVPGYDADKAITTEAELNWDVNAMLAFGAKGILYYINVTPPYAPYDTSSGMDPHSLIDASGTPTDYYDYVKDINAQIQAIDHVLMKSQHLGVIVNGSGACGYSESTGKTTLLNTTSELGTVKLSSVSGTVLIGAFNYNGQTAMLVMNNTTDNDGVADSVTLNFTGAYSYEVIQDAVTAMSMGTSLNLSLLPGRCALVVVHDNLASTQVSFAGTEVTEEAKTVYVDFPYGELPAPEREGYLFAGWFTDETYTTQVTAETIVTNTEEHILYAKWLELCNISFDLNYTDAGENPAAITPIKGDTYGDLPVPEREGYTFLGWYTDTAYTQAVASNTVATENRTLFAKWSDICLNSNDATVITKTVTYTEEGAIFNYKSTTTVEGTNRALRVSLPADTYKGFAFKIRFNECVLADGNNSAFIYADSTTPSYDRIYVTWYDENGVKTTTPEVGQWYTVNLTTRNNGETSAAWVYVGSTDKSVTKLDVSIKDLVGIPVTGGEFTVDLNLNYPDAPAQEALTVAPYTAYGTLSTPEYYGYEFLGWYKDAEYTQKVTADMLVTGSHTLYAKWNPVRLYVPTPAVMERTITETDDGLVYNYKSLAQIEGDSRALRLRMPKDTYKGLSMMVYFEKATLSNDTTSVNFVGSNTSGTGSSTITIKFYDANGNEVALADRQTGQWYTVTMVGATTLNSAYIYVCTSGAQSIKNLDLTIRDMKPIPLEEVTVDFNMNGKDAAAPDAMSVAPYTTYGSLSRPAEVADYEFMGWYKDAKCTQSATADMLVTGSHTLYAKWAEAPIKINSPDASYITKDVWVGEKGFEYNFKATKDLAGSNRALRVSLPADTYKGFAFKIRFNECVLADGNNSAFIYADSTTPSYDRIYVTWYDENGVKTTTPEVGQWYTVNLTTRNNGETSAAWVYVGSTDKSVTKLDVSIKDLVGIPVSGGEFTVNFDLNGKDATAPEAMSVAPYTTYGSLSRPAEVAGYEFVGWYKDPACTQAATADMLVTGSHTLYAKWIEASVKINSPDADYVSKSVSIGEKGVEYNFKSKQVLPSYNYTSLRISLSGDNKGFAFKIRFNKCLVGDSHKAYLEAYDTSNGNASMVEAWYDEDGKSVTNPKMDEWYTVVISGNKVCTSAWLYVGSTSEVKELDVSIKEVVGIPVTGGEFTVNFDMNGKDATAPDAMYVAPYTTYGTLPTDVACDGYQIIGWYLDAACTKPVTANTLVTKSHTLYAKWGAAVSFTWPDNGYYATVAGTELNGEAVYEYTAKTPADAGKWHPGVYAKVRKVMMHIDDSFGDTISMQVLIEYVKDVNGTSLNTSKMAVYASGSGDPLAVTFKDAEGKTVANDALAVGQWYTMTFTAVGAKCYEIHPFNAGGEKGDFYMKDIQRIEPEVVEDDFGDPLLRFAVTSDVHVYDRSDGNPMAKLNLSNLFNVAYGYANLSSTYKNLDAVLVAGDISEGTIGEFNTFKSIVEGKIQEGTAFIVGMGNHDFRLDGTDAGAQTMVEAFEERFGPVDQHVVINGYHFISLSPAPENLNGKGVGETYTQAKLDWLDAKIQEAIKADPNKPVFVMQHHHPSDTVYGSENDNDYYAGLYGILAKYPQVVDFSGHSHRPVNDPRNVWQGNPTLQDDKWQDAFTAIGTGTLYYVGLDINGGPTNINIDEYLGNNDTPGAKNGEDYGMFQIVEVNADNDIRIIVYDLRTFEELYRFVIENPVDPANHVTNEEKAEASVVPEFAEGAEIEIEDVDGVKYVYVPQAVSTEVIESYRAYVTVNGVTTTYYGLSGYVYPNQPEYARIKIGQLDTNEDYKIEVVAVNAYGKESTVPLVEGNTVPKAQISFDLNYSGAGAAPEAIEFRVGNTYGTLPTPTRAQTRTTTSGGYTFYYGFAGWYTNAECTGEAVKPTDVVTEARPLYAKWEKAILMSRATNSVYSDPTLQYIEGEWVYVYANNGTARTSAEQERMNLHLPEKIAYAVSYKVMLTNETDAALFYTDSGNLGVDIYDANGILLYKRNYKNGGTTTQVTLEEGKWYTIVHSNRDSSAYYVTGLDYFGVGAFSDGAGGATMYVKDIEIATENAPSTAAVDVYTNNVSLYPNRDLRVIDGEWAWVFAGNQAQTTQSGRFLRFNIKTGPVSKVTFKLMADNCTGDVVLNYAQVGSAAVTFKDPDGNAVDWDKLQTGVWYDCVFTRATAMAAAADWSIGYFGTGTGGMDIYFKDIQLVPAA